MSYEGRIVYVPREQKKLRRLSKTRLLVYGAILCLFAIIGGIIYVLRFPDWQIRNIEISGIVVLDENDLRVKVSDFLSGNYLFLIPKRSIFVLNGEKTARFLRSEFSRIEAVDISKKFPDSLKISVKERVLWAIFCGAKNCVYVDKNGIAYEEAPSFSGSLILKITSDVGDLKIPSKALEDLMLGRMNLIAQELKERLEMEVVGYELFSKIPKEIRVAVSDGFKIYLNRDDDFKKVFEVMKTVLEEEVKDKRARLEYMDLRFGNKVFYKVK